MNPNFRPKIDEEIQFKKGYKIFHEINPFVHVLYSNWKNKRCDYCFKITSLKKCSGCYFMSYCSELCQKLDWNPCHKIECKSKFHLYLIDFEKCVDLLDKPKYETALIQMCFRFLIKYKSNLVTSEMSVNLFNHEIKSPSRIITLATIWTKLSSSPFIKNYFANYNNKFYLIFCALEKYRIQICENNLCIVGLSSEQIILGEGLYIELSIFPHSCISNTSFSFNNTKLTLSLIENLISLSQVNVNYLDVVGLPEAICLPANIRSNLLLIRNFTCKCLICELPDFWQEDSFKNIILALFTMRRDLFKNADNHISALTHLIKFLKRKFHHSHTIISLMLFRLAYFYTISNKWSDAIKTLDELCTELVFTHSKNQVNEFIQKYALFRNSLENKSRVEIQFLSGDFFKMTKLYC